MRRSIVEQDHQKLDQLLTAQVFPEVKRGAAYPQEYGTVNHLLGIV